MKRRRKSKKEKKKGKGWYEILQLNSLRKGGGGGEDLVNRESPLPRIKG